MGAEKARKTVVLKQHIQCEHGAPPSYRRKRADEDKVNQINLTTTPAPGPAHDDVEAEIFAGLDELDVDDPAHNVESDEERDPMAVEPQVSTFDDIARDLMESGDEGEDDEEQASDSEDELSIDDPEAWQLVNLFTYPTFSADADRTQSSESFAFMVDYWNQGKTRLEMEQEQHEILSRDMELGNESNDE